jgi:hypothetical protein
MIPKQLRYGSKVESASSRSYRTNIAPQNGTGPYLLNDTIIINIPTRRNLVLTPAESLLKFTTTFTNTAANNALRWDSCGAHGIIQKIVVKHGSNVIETIENYGLLVKMLYDIQVPLTSTMGKLNILTGTRSDLPIIATGGNRAVQANSGERLDPNGFLSGNGVATRQTYCINLVSILGSLGVSNYIPLFEMTSCSLTIEITLVDSTIKALSDLVGSTFQMTNVEYLASFIELSDSAMQMIYSEKGDRPIQYVFPSFRNYQYVFTLTGGATTQVQFPISAKFSSLRSLFITIRDKGLGAATFFPFSSVTCGLIDYQFRVGSVLMPSKPPNSTINGTVASYSEHYSELLKAIGTIADVGNCGAIDKFAYQLAASVANTDTDTVISAVSSGSFYVGIDLEGYSGSDKSSVFAGMDTNTSDIYCIMNFYVAAAVTPRFDAFAMLDCVLICENQTAYIRF